MLFLPRLEVDERQMNSAFRLRSGWAVQYGAINEGAGQEPRHTDRRVET